MGWLWLKGCQSPAGAPLPHPYSLRCSLSPGAPGPREGWGWGEKEEKGSREGRAQAARARRERGRSRRVGAGWLRRQDWSRRGPGMDSFPPLLLPSPLISDPQVPTSHHTHLEATPTIFSPPAPHFLLSLLSWAQKDVGVSEQRVGEGVCVWRGWWGNGSEPFPLLHQAKTSPLPQPLVDRHIIFMSLMNTQCPHYGAGVLLGSAFPFTTP